MTWRRRGAVGALLLGASSLRGLHAQARPGETVPPIAQEVARRLASAAVVRGEFEQRKSLAGFRNPLVSRGAFVVARQRGVWWHTRPPFESSLVMTRERLVARQADGSIVRRLDAKDEPTLRTLTETLLALLAGDLPALAPRFRIEGSLQGSTSWQLRLLPRDPAMTPWLRQIEMEGERFPREVRLSEAQGDQTLIVFSQQSTADALTREEAARFE